MIRRSLSAPRWATLIAICCTLLLSAGPVTLLAQDDHAATESAADAHAPAADAHAAAEGHGDGHNIGTELPLWSVIPFAGILLSIALFPLLAMHFWHHNYPKVAAFWAAVFAIPFLFIYKGQALYEILHIYIVDYIPFIILLAGLFTVSGGIVLRGTLVGTPVVNVLFILVGTIMSSMIGTTGSSMLLIRPLLRANAHRERKAHIVIFFIFLVSNMGGSLTPLGDPPLFLGFLHGVPFQWTLSLLPEMGFSAILLLILFYFLDTMMLKREPAEQELAEERAEAVPISIAGAHNFLFLLGIIGGVLLSGLWKSGDVNIAGVHADISGLTRDGIIILMAVLAYLSTKQRLREENGFTWEPIREVAYLFAGIFMTIIPALAILKAGEEGALKALIVRADSEPAYFWFTGILSSFLDNAPTYLTYFNTALGKLHLHEDAVSAFLYHYPLPIMGISTPDPAFIAQLFKDHAHQLPHYVAVAGGDLSNPAALQELTHNLELFESYLKAIAVGAVFMGANTYIGNAPNFMVRSIAEENHVKMPSFFGYMAWSGGILIPLFIIITFVFFR